MKVLKCSSFSEKVTAPKVYTGHELETSAPEGVYSGKTNSSSSRYVVFHSNPTEGSKGDNVVLFVLGGVVVGSCKLGVSHNRFTKLEEEKVVFEIKEVT